MDDSQFNIFTSIHCTIKLIVDVLCVHVMYSYVYILIWRGVEVFFIPGGLPWLLLQTDREMDESLIVWGACGIHVKGQSNQRQTLSTSPPGS